MSDDSKSDTVTSKKGNKQKGEQDQQTMVLRPEDMQKMEAPEKQKTQIINKEEMKTMMVDPQSPRQGSGTMMYELDGMTPEVPTMDEDEPLDTAEQSKVLKNLFPDKTKEEKLKINRNFLRDVEPFKLERLVEEIKTIPENLKTGFTGLDHTIRIPQSAITLIASHSRIDKNLFLLNLLWNLVNQYPYKHFLYYTYEDIRRELEMKLINLAGDTLFPKLEGMESNLERWKDVMRNTDAKDLQKISTSEKDFKGLDQFSQVANRLHFIDTSYNITDLLHSIRSFDVTFPVGGVFIDLVQKIRPDRKGDNQPRDLQLQHVVFILRRFANQVKFPVIAGTLFKRRETDTPEYDRVVLDEIIEGEVVANEAHLIIGLQNYARSRYIGSHSNDNFTSRFFNQPILKAEAMPSCFREHEIDTVFLAKVLENLDGPEPEVELHFHKKLLRLSDLNKDTVNRIKKEMK